MCVENISNTVQTLLLRNHDLKQPLRMKRTRIYVYMSESWFMTWWWCWKMLWKPKYWITAIIHKLILGLQTAADPLMQILWTCSWSLQLQHLCVCVCERVCGRVCVSCKEVKIHVCMFSHSKCPELPVDWAEWQDGPEWFPLDRRHSTGECLSCFSWCVILFSVILVFLNTCCRV